MDADQMVEKKLGLSLDELIAQQRVKQAKTKPAGGSGKKKTLRTPQAKSVGGGGRVLVVPRPKRVPRPSASKSAGLKGTRGGGVQKGGPAPKFYGGNNGRQQGGGGSSGSSRNVKVTIGNKISGRPAGHFPTSGVLSKPFVGAAGGGGGSRGGSGRAPMHMEAPAGAPLSARFDTMHGSAPSGAARPSGAPQRRNAHGVIMP